MKKQSKAQIRQKHSAIVYKAFIDSGKEFTCGASLNIVRSVAIDEAKKCLANGVNLSKSNYSFSFVGNMADMFLTDAWKMAQFDFRKN
jgi:hypothetical protein